MYALEERAGLCAMYPSCHENDAVGQVGAIMQCDGLTQVNDATGARTGLCRPLPRLVKCRLILWKHETRQGRGRSRKNFDLGRVRF